MASIATSIQIYDRVSAPINNMIAALDNMCTAYESVQDSMNTGFNTKAIENARQAINSAAEQTVQLEKEQGDYNKKLREGAADASGLTSKIFGLVGAYASFMGVQKLVNLSDEYVQTTARLNMVNDGLQTTEELQKKIFASAQRSRASYATTADIVAKLSQRTGKLFTNDEAIAFTENLNKHFVVAGANQAEIASASLQLTQALGSGVLRGEEFNAVFEAAPNIMQTVADYMGVPIGQLRNMAAEGQITADIVKNAMLGATDEINAEFESMPMTWGQVMAGVMNKIYYASMPLLEAISFLANNWAIIEPIVLGAAAALGVYLIATQGVATATKVWTAVQAAFNAVMAMNPVGLIVMAVILLIALIFSVVAAINKVTGTSLSATGIIVGALTTAVAFIWNLFLGLVDLVLGVVNYIANPWIAFANFFGNLFNDPIGAIIHLFGDLADNVLGIVETIAKALDKVFGSNLAGTVQGWRSGLDSMVEEAANKHGNGSYEKVADSLNLSSDSLGLKRWDYGDAYNTGYSWGEGAEDKLSGMFGGGLDGLTGAVGNIDTNTGKIADSMDITSEDLKYLKDLAERDTINRFTTAEIRIEQTNNNSINSELDIDGVVDRLTAGVDEAMEKIAEGVHE